MEIIGKCEKCKKNLVKLGNGNVVCRCTEKALDERLRIAAEGKIKEVKKMKTAVTVIEAIQTETEYCKHIKKTKVFEDNATLFDIKQWAKEAMNLKGVEAEDISLGSLDFSDVDA